MRRGNDHAFRLFIEKYRNDIYKVAYSVLRNEKDAEDAAQDIFLKIYYSLPKYEGKGLKTWMTRIAVNHSIDMKRKKERWREDVTEDLNLQFKTASTDSVEGELLKKEMKSQVLNRVNELPKNYRDVVYGYYIQEKSSQQLAIELDVKEKTIVVKLHRARNWMRKRWKEEDFE
ncbi:sigma-70 family RNA polymerase sigma factor [Bacillaceae bacterium IKA-2]|nr:sigma-70 family RNA polymerase sigma factor [Bacillaceae bacterium IKA-2]